MTNNSTILNERLSSFVPFFEGLLEKHLRGMPDAVKYCVSSGGKRLRPFMLFECAKLFGEPDENIERLAVGIELIHGYSLVHDDMPCMDNDDYRRGIPSCHKAFGEWQALLSGDCLLNLAFEIMLNGNYGKEYFDSIKYIAKCSGYFGMAGGQWLDLGGVNNDNVLKMIEGKTSALFMASCAAPAIYFGKKSEAYRLEEFSKNFGIMFQIKDDIKDADKDEQASYLKFHSIDESMEHLNAYKAKAQNALTGIKGNLNVLFDLLNNT